MPRSLDNLEGPFGNAGFWVGNIGYLNTKTTMSPFRWGMHPHTSLFPNYQLWKLALPYLTNLTRPYEVYPKLGDFAPGPPFKWGALLPTTPIFPKVTFINPLGCDALHGRCVFQRLLLLSLILSEWF